MGPQDPSLRKHPVFSVLISPAEKNYRERSDDWKYVWGSQAIRTQNPLLFKYNELPKIFMLPSF